VEVLTLPCPEIKVTGSPPPTFPPGAPFVSESGEQIHRPGDVGESGVEFNEHDRSLRPEDLLGSVEHVAFMAFDVDLDEPDVGEFEVVEGDGVNLDIEDTSVVILERGGTL
jgi:hypothetical protein